MYPAQYRRRIPGKVGYFANEVLKKGDRVTIDSDASALIPSVWVDSVLEITKQSQINGLLRSR